MIDSDVRDCMESVMCPCVRKVSKEKALYDDGKFVCHPIRVGLGSASSILLYGKRRSRFPFHCIVGPDWPVVLIVYALIIGINAGILRAVAPLGYPVLIIGGVGAIGLLCSYSCVALSDPGIIYKDDVDDNTSMELTASIIINNNSMESGNIIINSSANGSNNNNNGNGYDNNTVNTGDEGGCDLEEGIAANIANSESKDNNEDGCSDGSGSNDGKESSPIIGTFSSSNSNGNSNNNGAGGNSSAGSSTSVASNIGSSVAKTRSTTSSVSLPVVPRQATMECGHCQIQRPLNARHCVYCGSCCENLDHHCPWCGKCIGERNMAAFKTFISLLCVQIYFLFGTFIYFCIAVYGDPKNVPKGPSAGV